ncbi:MAG: PTS mannose transporter subunit IID [Roseiflexaceae bacterium]|nr:PTS mannose transporter subunit IID [Roseiflexaceae bacterium]
MVGLLIVAHSANLAEGVREIAAQVSDGRVPIGVAGGTIGGGLGTSVDQIVQELQRLATLDGVLILTDLKGAVLSVEAALERIGSLCYEISDAPLVEGAYLAVIEASVGGTLAEVAAAALQARDMHKRP